MATWLTTLPRPQVAGYAIAPVDVTVRTDMEAGLPRVRRRSAARNDQVSVAWRFTDAQMATFRAWFDGDCANGASWFTVACNYFNDGTCRIGPQEQDKAQYPNWKEIKCEYGVLQDNRLDDLFFNVRLGTYHVIFRNNVSV